LLKPSAYLTTARGLLRNAAAREAIFPFYASFKITSRCHFGCPFCNVRRGRTADLSTKTIQSILDNLSRSPVLMVSFEGGEPLLREDIGELLRYARTRNFYLLFTTSARNLLEFPLRDYARYIDFLHVSIDEGHDNLEMFDLLPSLQDLPTQLSVQTVVTNRTVDALDDKVRHCWRAGANIVVIPASPMDHAENCFPDIDLLESRLEKLRRAYPHTIHTPRGYFDAYRRQRCSSASVIIAPDGRLYYPCHIRGDAGCDLSATDLNAWLVSDEARDRRREMHGCTRNCGWYQYYAIDSYTSPQSVWEAIRPMLFQRSPRRTNLT
jgi:MoaA/NifB/PqqE/SkfB family radical SAM enzyme